MTTYLICYDINKEGATYSAANKVLIDAIKAKFSTWWHHLDSTWIVATDMTAVQIRNYLTRYLDTNDELLVVLSGQDAARRGFTEKGSKWLQVNL